MGKPIDITDIDHLERLVKNLKRDYDDIKQEISMEFVIANLFPKCWQNMQNALTREYVKGYEEGAKLVVLNKKKQ